MKKTEIEQLHDRLLKVQKEMQLLKTAAYADHRMIENLSIRLDAQFSMIKRLTSDVKNCVGHH